MIPRKTPLKRSTKPIARNTPVKKKRSKPRRNKVSVEEYRRVRLAVYERAGGKCELKRRPDCIQGVLPYTGVTPWDHGHLVHKKSEGSGGETSLANCVWGCFRCHLLGLHRGDVSPTDKPVPAKNPQPEQADWTRRYDNY